MVVSVGKMMMSKFRGTHDPIPLKHIEPKRARDVFETKWQAEVELTIREMR